ncbi:uncharacterized protein LOC117647880 [Thrips palmi]|uniref:Uncharacterized protein LOC117647880 n=1 Tax=Thrips palmi TaxID=161013 RepID=A0A6P8YZY8_THRPL|nr:uncharacterized protein LOC117647880 [Thrips palmi]
MTDAGVTIREAKPLDCTILTIRFNSACGNLWDKMYEDMDTGEAEDQYSAVIYWVEEKKVGIAPIVLVPCSDRSVGTYTKIRPPGSHKDYTGRIEGISANPDVLERIQAEVSNRIDEEAAKVAPKRNRSQVKRFGKVASETAVQVASGHRRSVPASLARENTEVSKLAKVGKANRKAAQSALSKLVHGSLNCNNPTEQKGSNKKSNIMNLGLDGTGPKKRGNPEPDFNPNELMMDAASEDAEDDDDCNDNDDESEVDSLLAITKEKPQVSRPHQMSPQIPPLFDKSTKPSRESRVNSSPQGYQNSSQVRSSPLVPQSSSLHLPSPAKVSSPHPKSPQMLLSLDKSKQASPRKPKSNSPQAKSPVVSQSPLQASFERPNSQGIPEGEDLTDDKNKAGFFQFMRLKKMYTPSVLAFLNELIDTFDQEQENANSDGEAEYVETVAPPANERQVEISKTSGVSISASARQVILLTGSKLGPSKMLTALVHELFKDRLKLLHGTAMIRPHVLKAIISFMEKNSEKSTALGTKDIKRIINNLACEARRAPHRARKGNPSPNAVKKDSPKEDSISTPKKSESSRESLAVKTTPSKNTWSVNQVQQYSYGNHDQGFQHQQPIHHQATQQQTINQQSAQQPIQYQHSMDYQAAQHHPMQLQQSFHHQSAQQQPIQQQFQTSYTDYSENYPQLYPDYHTVQFPPKSPKRMLDL